MNTTDLVFRTVGERTSDLALELAIENIRPKHVEVIRDLRPLAAAVEKQCTFSHNTDQVVYVDADCLILDDMVPFLQTNYRPYVDCFVTDRFRGRIHCGVHVTRTDVVKVMKHVHPAADDKKYVLRPESRLRNLALHQLKKRKEFRNFNILHDHFQFYRDIFYKYAIRELRSRTEHQYARLETAMESWKESELDQDIQVARLAIEHARKSVPLDSSASRLSDYIDRLPQIAVSELDRAGIKEKRPLKRADIESWVERYPLQHYGIDDRPRIFGIGLSRTGTRSLSMALHILGWDTVHYPADQTTFEELSNAQYDLSILKEYHGITDITVAPFYAQLDTQFPGAKFVLTVRDREHWLNSCQNHWKDRPAFAGTETPEQEIYMKIRRLLRAAVYGCYTFNIDRFNWVYEQHLSHVRSYFRDRPNDFLELDICSGAGWDPLCRFLGQPVPQQPFPHKGAKLSKKLKLLAELSAASVKSEPALPAPDDTGYSSDFVRSDRPRS